MINAIIGAGNLVAVFMCWESSKTLSVLNAALCVLNFAFFIAEVTK